MTDQDHPLGPDLLADRLQVRDVALQGVVSRVSEPGGPPAAHHIVDVDVEALPGELSEVFRVPLHTGDARVATQEDDGRRTGTDLGGDTDVGDARAGKKLPEPLPSRGGGRQTWVFHREQGRPREGARDQGGAGAEPHRGDTPAPIWPDPARGEHQAEEIGSAEGCKPGQQE